MEMELRGEQSISLSMSRVAEMTTSAVINRGRVVKSSEEERKERMDTSSLMEQILSTPKGVLLVKLIEPPCTEWYARWCERSVENIILKSLQCY